MCMRVKQLWEINLCDVTKLIDPSLLITNISRQLNLSHPLSYNCLLEGQKRIVCYMEQENLKAKYAVFVFLWSFVGHYSHCSTCVWAEK